jgi:hypothetical protein
MLCQPADSVRGNVRDLSSQGGARLSPNVQRATSIGSHGTPLTDFAQDLTDFVQVVTVFAQDLTDFAQM